MNLKMEKVVRFYSDEKQQKETLRGKHNLVYPEMSPSTDEFSSTMLKVENGRTGGRTRHAKTQKIATCNLFPEDYVPWRGRILDPGSDIVLQWNKIFLISCVLALFMDPFYFYLPCVGGDTNTSCIEPDNRLQAILTFFGTIFDMFYLFHIIIKFRTAYVAPNSRIFGRGELVMDTKKIAWRFIKSDFFIYLFAALPLPQILVWIILPAARGHRVYVYERALALIFVVQYVPRLYLIFPLNSEIIRANGVVTKTAWTGAAYNLLFYLLGSHVAGAGWYISSIDRYTSCWNIACGNETGCSSVYFDCANFDNADRVAWAASTQVFNTCSANNFNFGIYGSAVSNNAFSTNFLEKFIFCFWWGLQQLSSYGQNLTTSTYIGETTYSFLVGLSGLVLLAHFIGVMETYLQSITVRVEQWRLKRRDTEEWMSHRQLPKGIRDRVRRFGKYKWLATRGVNEEDILHGLPADLRREIKRHLCLDLVRRVSFFSQMDDQLLDAICERLVSSLSTEGTYIFREGDPVKEILFIIRGRLDSSTTDGGRIGFFNSIMLNPGDFCGEELLAWALHPISSNLPSSTRTVRALTEVEAFALRSEDLKFVANQFRHLHSKKLQHTFRYHSHHWRTWAARFIQAAWSRHKKRMKQVDLAMSECLALDETEATEPGQGQWSNSSHGLSPKAKLNSGVRIILSRFAADRIRREAQDLEDDDLLRLQKPEEPDFSGDER